MIAVLFLLVVIGFPAVAAAVALWLVLWARPADEQWGHRQLHRSGRWVRTRHHQTTTRRQERAA